LSALSYAIRPYRPTDASALAALTLAAIQTVGAHSYAANQVAAWAARHQSAHRFVERADAGAAIFVAADAADQPAAYALLEPDGHLDMLYCHPDHTQRGLAEQLLAAAEAHALAHGITRLYTEASELARKAFARSGYVLQHRRDFAIDGVAIHNYAMEKSLR
jgi:putative acetyltransferase